MKSALAALAVFAAVLLSGCTAVPTDGGNLTENAGQALDMANYPGIMGGSLLVVVDDNATQADLAAAGAISSKVGGRVVGYGSLASFWQSAAIFVGTCNTEPHNKFANIFADCLSLDRGKATIRLTEMEGRRIVFAIGSDSESTLRAGTVLSNWGGYNLSGTEIEIYGDSGRIGVRIIK
jgi:hypothetical protein